MLTNKEAAVTLKFLDRCPLTGHGERQAMNAIVQKIYAMSQPNVPMKASEPAKREEEA